MEAAALALHELNVLRAEGRLTTRAGNPEVEHIVEELLRRYDCELVVDQPAGRFTLRDRHTNRERDLVADFFHNHHHDGG